MSCECCGDVPPHLEPFKSPDDMANYVMVIGRAGPIGPFCFTAIIEGWFYRAEFDPATGACKTLHRHTRDPLVALRDS
jgi:hypothetical protein